VAFALVPLLVAAACSASGTQGGAVACDTPGISPDQINLGLVYPTTGAAALGLQAVRAGINARLGLVNAAGGVYGRKITYDWRDDGGQASGNATAVRSLIGGSNVFGLLEETGTASGGAADLAARDIPVVGLSAESAVWARYPNMVATVATVQGSDVWGRILKERGVTRLAMVSEALSSIDSQAAERFVDSVGAVGVDATVLTVNATDDPASTAKRIVASGANGMFGLLGSAVTVGQIAQAMRAQGKPLRVALSFTGYDRNLLRTSGPALAGLYIPVFFRPFEARGPAMDQFMGAMAAYAPQVADPRQEFALRAYVDADLFVRGLEMAGPCPTRAGFLTSVHSLTSYDADGLVQPVDLRPGARQEQCVALVQVNPAGTDFAVVTTKICGLNLPG
jgi:ABC-type branched-subunit amino acid transport system substrate-binding protein